MKISAEMAEMIQRAVAEGRVEKVAPGVSGIAAPKTRGRPRTRPEGETASEARARRAAAKAETLRDRRRFKTTAVPMGAPRIAPADATGTIYPARVLDASAGEPVLKDGSSNAKIGGDVLKGPLRGARIYTLTLEERATCPRSCALWATCYGNAMPHPRRWRHGPALETAIEREIASLCATYPLVLIRLHVLGDFYSFDYLALWTRLLDTHPGLHVFGFTAWAPGTRIGDGIARVRAALGHRFAIRHSGRTGRWGAFTIEAPTARRRVGDAVVCPEQAAAMRGEQGRHCGNCGLCWASDVPIVFVEH
ncbi:GP88 family protein [Frigidibacter oleivorans]|uniref:GP88 family protein n=1 Tax=Frigidibacter oleivorans TaxID=2487129 RepID=UPI000F8F5413|nr:hypothetical protein [Frigidibacter oleivorans]